MRHVSLVTKVCLALCLAQVPLVGMLLAVTLTTRASIAEHSQALLQATQVKGLAATSLALLLTQQDVTKSMLLNPENIIEAPRKIQAHDDHITVLHTLQALATAPEVIDLVQQLTTMDERELMPLDTAILETLGDEKVEAARALYFTTYEPKRLQYEALTKRLGKVAETVVQEAADHLNVSSRRAVTLISMTLGVGLTITLAASWLLARKIVQPLRQMVRRFQDIEGEGDLTQRVDVQRRDELGELGRWFNILMDKLHGIISQVQSTSRQMVVVSHDLSEVTDQFASGAQQQASSLEQTAASLEQITSTVACNADNARQVSQLSLRSHHVAEQGVQVVTAAIAAMQEITQVSTKIADIISVIDAIAFQTNLLALNAAVEAARAGEPGRGFAVVAAEVRRLAQRTTEAAKEIKTLIQDAGQKVNDGATRVHQSGQTLEEIVAAVKRVTDIITEIATASVEQAKGVEQVNHAVTHMDQMTQTNTTQTETLAATARALATQAAELQALVGQFKLHGRAAKHMELTGVPHPHVYEEEDTSVSAEGAHE